MQETEQNIHEGCQMELRTDPEILPLRPQSGTRVRMTKANVILNPAVFFPPVRRISDHARNGTDYSRGLPDVT
jgi:hypothetical protein